MARVQLETRGGRGRRGTRNGSGGGRSGWGGRGGGAGRSRGGAGSGMSVELRAAIRVGILGTLVVIVQTTALSQLTVFGAPPDVSPLFVAAVGLLAGSLAGAVTGFSVGLLVDVALFQTLGVTSLLFLAIGYGAGRLRELRDPAHGLTPLAVGAVASVVSAVGYAVFQFLLGVDAPLSWLLVRDIVVQIALNALLAMPIYLLVRRVLLPVLPEDPRRRRRRAYTTGGLSPLSRS